MAPVGTHSLEDAQYFVGQLADKYNCSQKVSTYFTVLVSKGCVLPRSIKVFVMSV